MSRFRCKSLKYRENENLCQQVLSLLTAAPSTCQLVLAYRQFCIWKVAGGRWHWAPTLPRGAAISLAPPKNVLKAGTANTLVLHEEVAFVELRLHRSSRGRSSE